MMKTKTTRLAGVLTLTLLCVVAVRPAHAQVKKALLVHVSQFKNNTGIPRIGSTGEDQNDLKEMRNALTPYGFQMTELKNSKASRELVLAALNDLVSTSKPDDTLIFYFSGHGATENNHFNLCPYDALSASSENDITESDLQQWLDKLPARNVTLILDCCFSKLADHGRGGQRFRTKFMPRASTSALQGTDVVNFKPERAVILSGAKQNGVALQISPYNDNAWVGLFTYQLAAALRAAKDRPETTYRQLMDTTCVSVDRWFKQQEPGKAYYQVPTLYGADPLVDRPLFAPVTAIPPGDGNGTKPIDPPHQGGGTTAPITDGTATVPTPPVSQNNPASLSSRPLTPPPAYVAGQKAGQDKVVLNQGAADGVTTGSEYAVFGPAETKFAPQKQIGTMRVESVTKDHAVLVPVAEANAAPDKKKPVVLPAKPRLVPTKYENEIARERAIVIALKGTPAFQTAMQQALSGNTYLKTILYTPSKAKGAESQPACHMIVEGEMDGSGLSARVYEEDGTSLVDPDAPQFRAQNAAELTKQISPSINRLIALRAATNLNNPSPAFQVKMEADKTQYVEGDKLNLTLTADRDCYVFVYSVDALGFPSLLYPIRASDSNLITANKSLLLPPDGTTMEYPASAPFGNTSVMVLAITDAKSAQNVKDRLFETRLPDDDKPGGRAFKVVKNLQGLQLSRLDTWAVSTLNVLTVTKAQAAGK